jgi:Ca-activated chloride channel family protein
LAFGLTFVALVGMAGEVAAQGWIEPIHSRPVDPVVARVRSDVTVTVDGTRRVARFEVEEVFRNRSGAMLEGDYLYPIPAGAVFTDFSLYMGDQELKGEVLPAEKARAIYEEIVRRKKDPALIELVGHGVLRARVFPIDPGDTRRIVLRYTQVLGRDGDLLRLRYPRVVGIIPGTEHIEQAGPLWQGDHDHPFSLTVRVENADLFATPYSPTHTIEVRERDGNEIVITHEGRGDEPRDFQLFLPLREALLGASIVTHALGDEPGYYMLLVSPPPFTEEVGIPRDLTMVLDISGSMEGDKMEQARAALRQLVAGLRAEDRFRIITFNSVVRTFRRGFTDADRANIEEAREYLSGVRPEGSTNIQVALEEALRPDAAEGRLSLVVFLTDGKPTVGETAPERIAQLAEGLLDRERVFAFGVGHDVNTYLLDRLSEGGRGTTSYVRPGEDVEVAVASLSSKISHPALSDFRIVDAPAHLEDSYPSTLPDLFYGEELVVFGRYRGEGSGTLVLEGSRAGETQRFEYRVDFARREHGNTFIPRLWAARKAGALTAQVRLHGASTELIEEIRELGLRYGILTEYTSYLVEEPNILPATVSVREAVDRAQAMSAPAEAQVGASAFTRADRSSRMRQADTMAEAEKVMITAPGAGEGVANEGAVRHAGNRLFVARAGEWRDIRLEEGVEVVELAPFSDAYFELLRRVPEIGAFFALGERVIIAGDGVTLRLTPEGLTKWEPEKLSMVLRGFGAGR